MCATRDHSGNASGVVAKVGVHAGRLARPMSRLLDWSRAWPLEMGEEFCLGHAPELFVYEDGSGLSNRMRIPI